MGARNLLTPHSLYVALKEGLVPKGYVAEAERILDGYDYPLKPTRGVASRWRDDNDPSWDNVVRAYEEDR